MYTRSPHRKRGERWSHSNSLLLWILVGGKMESCISSLARHPTRVLCKPSTDGALGGDPAQGPGSLSKQNSLTEQFLPISIFLKLSKGNKKPQMGACLPSAPLHMQKQTHVKSTSWWCERTPKQKQVCMCSVTGYGSISCSFLPFTAVRTAERF